MAEDIAVTRFREYLRIKTVQPNPDYEGCVKFLFGLADELGIERKRYECVAGRPFVVMTIPGEEPDLTSILLYSHTDVVPVFPEHWKYDPFSAHKDEKGDIYARGAQDMKCVGSQYFEAIRRHFLHGKKQFRRTVHIVWGPDEEIGGTNGMEKFIETDEFKALNVGFALDEGLASESEIYKVYYAERCPWWIRVTFPGQPGHGSKFIEDTAAEKMQSFINNALTFRAEQKSLLQSDSSKTLGDVTSLNLTIVRGGVQTNVLPEKFECEFDIRVPPTVDYVQFEAMLNDWAKTAGKGTKIEYTQKAMIKNMTPTVMSDPFWAAFEGTLVSEGCEFTKEIFTGATDSRFLRSKGLRSIGFSPMKNTPSLLHDHNEYLNEKVFLRGVEIYEKLIENLASVPKE
ncbi:unnamed protein product, partial [Mesorhabditis belari]|uniref:N-acyl-aliphatic-L-amino acid amidohydrolase n=1 Tax=Mesorhabditis belari TaxID=2138241 RepID=A0AAF3JB60_9BILA